MRISPAEALVVSLAFLPMALAATMNAEVQGPIALVVIEGLVTSTLVTVLIIPALNMRMSAQRVWSEKQARFGIA